jgi:hypothetical protein
VSGDHEKRETVCKQFGRSACDAVDCDGMTDCAFANENASVWETGPFLSRALRAERAECRRPSRDPWTVQGGGERVSVSSGRRKNGGDVPRS